MHEYFTMQLKNDRNRKLCKYFIVFLMLILPILLVFYKSIGIVLASQKESNRLVREQEEIKKYGEAFIKNQAFLETLSFKNNQVVVLLDEIYDGKYPVRLEKKYFDKKYTHQCLGYFTITKKEDTYTIDTSTYCQM